MPGMTSDTTHLPRICQAAVEEFARMADALVETVNARMTGRADLDALIGSDQVGGMFENHRNHADFWAYRTHSNRGFSHAYFATVLPVWIDVILGFMGQGGADIQTVCQWMLARHEETVRLSLRPPTEPAAGSPERQVDCERFRDALLAGDVLACPGTAGSRVDTADRMGDFFMHARQPALPAVGESWEKGLIGVAQEPLASAIVSSTLAAKSVSCFSPAVPGRGKAVVSAAANEFLEIGAWMLASCLDSDGWDERYLGANTPGSDLLAFARSEKPDLLCLSVAMAFNIGAAKSVIDTVRSDGSLTGTAILVGGQACLHDRDIFQAARADGMATDCRSAMEAARAFICRRAGESRLS